MPSKSTFLLPKYTEYALGYSEGTLWLGIYRTVQGEFLWDDRKQQGTIPIALLKVIEKLWGRLVPGYAYFLDIERRQVQVLTMIALKAVLTDIATLQVAHAPVWWQDEREARALVDMLVAESVK